MSDAPFLMLFVPADRPERYAKAALAGADAIIVDLEDAVAETGKEAARSALVEGLRGASLGIPVYVRVNAAGTAHHAMDVEALHGLDIAGIILPKAEDAALARDLRSRLPAPTQVLALVESAKGVADARALAVACDRLVFGSIDFSLSIGARHTRDALLLARCELVLAAALAGRPAPIDGVTTSVGDAAEIEDDARHAHSLGFGGKLLIHPRQMAPALRGFAPTPGETSEARRILAASGGEAVALDGRMVDTPVVEGARRLVEHAERADERLEKLGDRA